MSATTITASNTFPATESTETTETTTRRRGLWKTGVAAGATASVATLAFSAVADAAGVSLEIGGEAIPLVGFAQLTFVCALIGTVLAVVLARRASNPQRTFVRTTVALTVISFVPDVLADAQSATKVSLIVSHLIAAAIVIPALARRLAH
jgi:hypothetical protein